MSLNEITDHFIRLFCYLTAIYSPPIIVYMKHLNLKKSLQELNRLNELLGEEDKAFDIEGKEAEALSHVQKIIKEKSAITFTDNFQFETNKDFPYLKPIIEFQ